MKVKNLTTSDGVKIVYKINRTNKPFLVFLHGLGGDFQAYHNLEPYLKDFSLLVPDLRGHGLSDAPAKGKYYKIEAFISDLNQIISKEKMKKFFLLGHCFGGTVAQVYAVKNPNQIKGLVLMSTVPYVSLTTYLMGLNPLFFAGLKLFSLLPFCYYCKRNRLEITKPYEIRDFTPKRTALDMFYTSPGSWAQTYFTSFNFDISKISRTIDLPTQIILATRDSFYKPKEVNKLKDFFPQAQIARLDTNHLSPLNQPRKLSAIIRQFISYGYRDKQE